MFGSLRRWTWKHTLSDAATREAENDVEKAACDACAGLLPVLEWMDLKGLI